MQPFIKELQPKVLGNFFFSLLKTIKNIYSYIPFFYNVDNTEASLKLFLTLMLALRLSRMQIFILLIFESNLKYEKLCFLTVRLHVKFIYQYSSNNNSKLVNIYRMLVQVRYCRSSLYHGHGFGHCQSENWLAQRMEINLYTK